MNKKKTIVAAVVLSAVVLVGGLLAYFTDTKTATNTFTVGNVTINLTEEHWVPANAQNLTPNAVVAKDPVITNTSANNKAFVFAKVEVPNIPSTNNQLFTYTLGSGWTELETAAVADGKTTHIYYYGSGDAMTELNAGASTSNVFPSVTMANITSTISGDQNIVVKAYGIQSTNLGENDTPAEIWSLVSGL